MVAVVVGACRPIFLSIRSSQWMIIPSHCSRTRKRTGHIHFVRGKKMGKKIRRRKRQEGRNEMGLERKDSYWAFSVCLFGPRSKRERIFQRFILVASFSLAFFFTRDAACFLVEKECLLCLLIENNEITTRDGPTRRKDLDTLAHLFLIGAAKRRSKQLGGTQEKPSTTWGNLLKQRKTPKNSFSSVETQSNSLLKKNIF